MGNIFGVREYCSSVGFPLTMSSVLLGEHTFSLPGTKCGGSVEYKSGMSMTRL